MRKSIDWKLGVFGIIALILALGLAVGDAVAVPSGTITSGARIIAGSDENAIQIRITGATEGGSFTIEPPKGFPPITDDNTDVTGGSVSADGAASQPATISVDDVTELTLLYFDGDGTNRGWKAGIYNHRRDRNQPYPSCCDS